MGRCPPHGSVKAAAVASSCRTGESSATRTTSSCSSTAAAKTCWRCARRQSSAQAAGSSPVAGEDPGHAPGGRNRLLGVPHPVAPQEGNGSVARLHVHRQAPHPAVEGEDPCPDPQAVATRSQSLPIRINQIVRGWSAYFRHAVAKNQFSALAGFIWWRVMRMLRVRHDWTWKDIRRRFVTPSGRWRPISAEGTELFDMAAVAVTRYRWRGARIPSPWTEIRARWQSPWRARCAERRTAGSARCPGKQAGSDPGTAPRAYSAVSRCGSMISKHARGCFEARCSCRGVRCRSIPVPVNRSRL